MNLFRRIACAALMAAFCYGATPTPKENLQRAVGTNIVTGSISGAVFQVATIAALKAVDVTTMVTGQIVRVAGYTSAGDGGGGDFTYNSSSSASDNAGTTIQPTTGSGRWLRVYVGALDVTWFGGVGNGTTDDTTAISNAIAAAGTNGGVFFPSGKTYKTTSLITIGSDGIVLSGYGATITSANATQWEKLQMTSRARVQILGLTFSCLYATVSAQTEPVIDVLESTDITIRDCAINDAPTGIRLSGACARVAITGNRFYKNFCAVFGDDNGVSMPTRCVITGNEIRTGLGTASTAFSGGIKLSGTGDTTSSAGHVIANNVIDTAGQMGIELQTYVNDCAVANNFVKGTGFGVSISFCSRTTVEANTLIGSTVIGIELADSQTATATGNAVSAASGADGVGVNQCSYVAITGGTIDTARDSIHLLSCTDVTITGVHMRPGSNAGIDCQAGSGTPVGVTKVAITGCLFQCAGSTSHFIFLDATDAVVNDILIAGNSFLGNADNGISFYSPTSVVIRDVSILNNTTHIFCGNGALATSGVVTPASVLYAIRSQGNVGSGTAGANFSQYDFNTPYVTFTTSKSFWDYNYSYLEGGVVAMDSTGGNRSFELPNSNVLAGYLLTVLKTVAGNTVTVSGYAGQTINGGASVTLTAQWQRVTVQSTDAGWVVVQSN